MATDDEAARKERAQRLRRQINQMTSTEGEEDENSTSEPESPRDFIHRRMEELKDDSCPETEKD